MAALRFLYKVSLKRKWSFDEVIPAPKAPQKLPVVLSPEEVLQFLDCIASMKHRAILTICYAAGLRISEAVCLKPTHIDSKRMVIRSSRARDRKDRYVMLSPKLLIPSRLVASGKTSPIGSSRATYRAGTSPEDAVENICQKRASALPYSQADYAPFLAPRFCRSPTGTGNRRPHHSTAVGHRVWQLRPATCASPPARCAQPPALWTCSRTPYPLSPQPALRKFF